MGAQSIGHLEKAVARSRSACSLIPGAGGGDGRQPGLFDADERLKALSAAGDPLE